MNESRYPLDEHEVIALVGCACGARVGAPCVDSAKAHYGRRRRAVAERRARAARARAARVRAAAGGRSERATARATAVRCRDQIEQATDEFDRREHHALALWLAHHAHILIGARR